LRAKLSCKRTETQVSELALLTSRTSNATTGKQVPHYPHEMRLQRNWGNYFPKSKP
jgi:hypothetical protein